MSGGGLAGPNPNKIKGGKWTVVRFFLCSVGYSIAWMTLSSLLNDYSDLYGPSSLLLMNIAYFLPSIPLLVVSSFCDEWLDERFGVTRVVLARLVAGLGGCGVVCAVFPWLPETIWWLLATITALGCASAVAFSASYQMVARFANKNVISLGLGCVGSGLVVLALELALGALPGGVRRRNVWLLELTAGVCLAGLAASVSLLSDHWRAIEAWAPAPAPDALDAPLLKQDDDGELGAETPRAPRRHSTSLARLESASVLINYSPLDMFEAVSEGAAFNGDARYSASLLTRLLLTTGLRGADIAERETLAARIQSTPLPLGARTSGGRRAVSVDTATARAAAACLPRALPPMDGPGGAGAARPAGAARTGAPPLAPSRGPGPGAQQQPAAPTAPLVPLPSPFDDASGGREPQDAGAEPEPLPQSSAARTSYAWLGQAPVGAGAGAATGGPAAGRAPPWPPERGPQAGSGARDPPKPPESVASAGGGGGGGGLREVLGACAAVVFALFCSGVYFVLAFPFFTYVPSSGGIGARLPLAKVLFFARLFADVTGRVAPRLRHLAPTSPALLAALGAGMVATLPGYFLYILAGPRWHNDTAAVAYIAGCWAVGGYVNTGAYSLAPRLVRPQLRAAANGLLAITYQVAHTSGLLAALALALALFGGLGPR